MHNRYQFVTWSIGNHDTQWSKYINKASSQDKKNHQKIKKKIAVSNQFNIITGHNFLQRQLLLKHFANVSLVEVFTPTLSTMTFIAQSNK